MRGDQLEHAIRTACQIIGSDEVIIVGSQAILGTFDDASSRDPRRCHSRSTYFHWRPTTRRLPDWPTSSKALPASSRPSNNSTIQHRRG